MSSRYLWILWPVALSACSPSSPAVATQTPGTTGSSSGSTSADGDAGGNVAPGPDATASGGEDSAGGNEGAPVTPRPVAMETDGATDGGPGGDGASTASGDGGACPGLFCEDFEQGQGQLDLTNKWILTKAAGGTQEVQQQTVHSGKYAWHVHSTGTTQNYVMIRTMNAPGALHGSGPTFGRAYLFATANNSPHTELGFAGNPTFPNPNSYMEFAEQAQGSWQLGFDLLSGGFVEEASYPPAHDKMPVMTWTCIEWEFNDNPDAMVLWVDGTQIDQFDVQHIGYSSAPKMTGSILNGKSSGIIGGFGVFGFGFHTYGAANPFDYYYDDIVLDTKRVNCLP